MDMNRLYVVLAGFVVLAFSLLGLVYGLAASVVPQ